MKSLYLLFVSAAIFTASANAQTAQTVQQKETVVVAEKTFDFGKIPMGRPVTHRFVFTNKGTDSLRIENAMASCGCTTPKWNRKAIAPGASTEVEVGFNAAAEGHFEKPITVAYNNGNVITLTVKGNVYMACGTPAPENGVVQHLKQLNW